MNGKTLYLECASGISGDMAVAALLDLGADRKKLDDVLQSLRLEGFTYAITRKKSHGLAGMDFDVRLHHHRHAHDHHEHRTLSQVNAVIDRGNMTEQARALARKIFLIVAEAESLAHDCPLPDVRFHEIGAVDSIVDSVAAAVCFDDLGIEECIVTGVADGHGHVTCQHGVLPVPVPAVLNIARASGIPLRPVQVEGELATPTGMAIAAAFRTSASLPRAYVVQQVGTGLGKKDVGRPNMLRAMLISAVEPQAQIYVIESNIDDSTGEELGLAMKKLLAGGARDVHLIPCFMKKNRPGWLLRVVTDGRRLAEMEKLIFRHTTTIGMRKTAVDGCRMQREMLSVTLPCGSVQVKKCSFEGIVRHYPEYESVTLVAEKSGLDFRTVFNLAVSEASRHESWR
jgi:uncharacterized protein (TIGR00299 family) protein